MNVEIKENVKLLNEQGELSHPGYSTSLIQEYNRNDIKAKKFKIKEWDYYLIYNSNYAVALTIDDNSYMGMISASVINLSESKEKTTSIIYPFTNGKTNMPSTSKIGDIKVNKKRANIEFLNDGQTRILKLEMKKFDKEKDLKLEFTLTDEPIDSMVIATPFKENKKAFYYNQKIIGMKAEGYVLYGEEKIEFSKKDTLALLDWGRGVWTYKNTWYWGAGQGYVNNQLVGFNIGYGFGDTSNATENMLFIDGKAHKLDEVTFNIPKNDKGKENYLKPWTFTSNDKRFEMEFIPIIDRKSKTDIGIICSDQHQVFGKFNGTLILDDGSKIVLKDFVGFAEKVYNKW